MSNSALLLHAMITSWPIPQGHAPEGARFNADPNSAEFWRSQTRAVALLSDVERSLDGMEADGEDVEHYREMMIPLYQAVYSYSHPWQGISNNTRTLMDRKDLSLLKALGGQLRMIQRQRPFTGDELADLLVQLDETEEMIRSSTDIPDEIRRYLLALIVEARRAASELQTFGDVELRTITLELGAALLTTAEEEIPKEKTVERKSLAQRAKGLIVRGSVSAGMKMLDKATDAAADGTMDVIGGAFDSLGG